VFAKTPRKRVGMIKQTNHIFQYLSKLKQT